MKLKQIGSNQTQLTLDDGTEVFFSYETPVACKLNYDYFRTDKKWSQTTSRHVNKWLDGVNALHKPQSFFDALVLGAK